MAEISSVTDDAHGWNQLAEQLAERITAHVTAQVTIANAPYVVQLQAAMLEMRAACSGLEAAYLDLERAVNLQLAEAA